LYKYHFSLEYNIDQYDATVSVVNRVSPLNMLWLNKCEGLKQKLRYFLKTKIKTN